MWSILTNNWGTFMSGVGYTLASSILALIGSLIVGTLFALLEISPFKLSLIHISEPTRRHHVSRMPSSA